MKTELRNIGHFLMHIEEQTEKAVPISRKDYSIRELISKGNSFSIHISKYGSRIPRRLVLADGFIETWYPPLIKPTAPTPLT